MRPPTRTELTIDEESSGIIDTEAFLGAGTFVFDAQVHTAKGLPAGTGPGTVQEFVERGQLLTLTVGRLVGGLRRLTHPGAHRARARDGSRAGRPAPYSRT